MNIQKCYGFSFKVARVYPRVSGHELLSNMPEGQKCYGFSFKVAKVKIVRASTG